MAIDRTKIIETLSTLDVHSDKNGLIKRFNVLLTQLPARFWNSFADRLVQKTEQELVKSMEYLLYNAAHECGYHTGYGILTSQEWQKIIAPMVEDESEDVLHGLFALFTAWGWGDAEIVELSPCEKMVVRVYDYYEADVDVTQYGRPQYMKSYMITGVCAAFMELVCTGEYDPSGKPIGTYVGKQVKGIEQGDAYGEFIVKKAEEV